MENSLLYPVSSATRRVVSLDGMWKFQFDPESTGLASDWASGLPDPVLMPVPSSFCDLFTDKDSREYCGDFWYETDFFVPGEWNGCDVAIRFGSATHRARVFVNGVEVTSHEGGFLPFNADVAEIVRYNQYNKLAVLLNNELNEYMLPAGKTSVLSNGKKVAAPYFDFYNYAGLQRPVKLLCLPKEQVMDFTVNHRLCGADAEVDYTVKTNGDHDCTVEVYDADLHGRGLDLVTVKRDYECMKWIGANCFRTSHYPYAEELYQMADEEGFLIIDEVPAVGFMESTMNFLAANQGNHKPVGFFEKDTTPQLLENHKQALTEMITRDKNHASVIAWSILNEPQCTSEGTEAYFKPLFDLAHELDVQKRPRTYAIVMMSLPNTSKGQQFADFISLNRYYGWYVMGGYGMVDAEAAFRKEMDGWAQVLNGRPMIFTEYGADTLPTEHKLPSVMWSQEYQNEYLDMNHRVFDSYDFVQGELVWNFADFQTTEGIMRANGNKKGIFTRQRQPKDAAFHFRARWTSLPLDYKG